jgi:hypothetical protein
MKLLKRIHSWLGIVFGTMAIALLSGCAASGPAFTGWDKPPEGKALLYVYRKVNFQPDMVYTVKVDGETVGPVHHDGYLVVPITPGIRTVQVYEATYLAPATLPLPIKVEAGRIYPIEYDTSGVSFNYGGFNNTPLMQGRRRIVLRNMEQALPVLQTLRKSTP